MHDLTARSWLTGRLVQAGLSQAEAANKASLFAQATAALGQLGPAGGDAEPQAWFVPGRIEVLGKHTDYAAGRSLVVAVEQGFCMVASARGDRTIRMVDAKGAQQASFELDADLSPTPGHWSNYPMTVARRIARNFGEGRRGGGLRGADIAFASDLPPAAGMSSSSVLITASFLALSQVNDLPSRPEYRANIDGLEALAGYLGTVENGQTFGTLVGDKGVGTFGGSQDHTAMLCCQAGLLSQYSFCPVRLERTIAMPQGYVFAIGVSGVVAEKTREAMEKYNRVSRRVSAILDVWRRDTGRQDRYLADAVHSSPDAPDRLRAVLRTETADGFDSQSLLDRLEQFLAESEQIIPAAGDALAAREIDRFGEFVDRSQDLAERGLGNQVPQTIFLARCARELGAAAASAFGAGFGGSVWALIQQQQAPDFLSRWEQRYRQAHPADAARSTFLLSAPAPGAFCLTAARR